MNDGGTDRFFFIHVIKTGGGTFGEHIAANFAPGEVYPDKRVDKRYRKAIFRVGELISLTPERRARTRIFRGHFPFVVAEQLGISLVTLTILRDPVERTLSFLRSQRQLPHEERSLEEIYEDPVFFPRVIHNHQCKVFSLTQADRAESVLKVLDVDGQRLRLAKANLEKVDVLGLNERFDEFLAELADRYGWRFGAVSNRHVSEKIEAPRSLRRRIADDSAADVELFEHARQLYQRRRRTAGPRRRAASASEASPRPASPSGESGASSDLSRQDGRRFFFIHVMKTGGTTFSQHIRSNFAPDEVYPHDSLDPDAIKAYTSIGYLTGLPPERRTRIRVYIGHFPFVAAQLLGMELVTFTILREPVERTVSLLKQRKRFNPQNRSRSLEEIYEDSYFFPGLIHNHQAKLFAMTPEDRPEAYWDAIDIDDRRLEIAKANLEKVDVLGLQDRFDEFQSELTHRYGWFFSPVKNRLVSPELDVSSALRRRIAEDNAAELAFYEHAQALYAKRQRAGAHV